MPRITTIATALVLGALGCLACENAQDEAGSDSATFPSAVTEEVRKQDDGWPRVTEEPVWTQEIGIVGDSLQAVCHGMAIDVEVARENACETRLDRYVVLRKRLLDFMSAKHARVAAWECAAKATEVHRAMRLVEGGSPFPVETWVLVRVSLTDVIEATPAPAREEVRGKLLGE